jgi:3-dehydroquinate dehydratase type I
MICVSLAGLGFDECVRALNKAEFAEIRIDQLNFSEEQFRSVFSLKRNTIATCRPEKGDDACRTALLKLAIEAGAGYIDIEYEAAPAYRTELVDFARKHNCVVIISYHNYEKTPSLSELDSIISESEQMGADRVKLAVMAQGASDVARVMGLYDAHKNLIAFCMGKLGMLSRVAAPLLGADFTFAAYNRQLATAPGQLTQGELMDIYDIIG